MSASSLRILYWNLHNRNLTQHVCDLVRYTQANCVVLLENPEPEGVTLRHLASVSPGFFRPTAALSRFNLFSNESNFGLEEVYSADRLSLRRIFSGGTTLLLGLVHVVDTYNWDNDKQGSEVELMVRSVKKYEKIRKSRRTILLGDFNMNPFDPIMNRATGLNAMMTRQCIQKRFRKVQGRKYHYFYNPMWQLFDPARCGVPGTFYHTSSTKGNYGWNMLDQILIRPSAIPYFDAVEIVTTTGAVDLTNKRGRPDKMNASDHLPLLVTLRLK